MSTSTRDPKISSDYPAKSGKRLEDVAHIGKVERWNPQLILIDGHTRETAVGVPCNTPRDAHEPCSSPDGKFSVKDRSLMLCDPHCALIGYGVNRNTFYSRATVFCTTTPLFSIPALPNKDENSSDGSIVGAG